MPKKLTRDLLLEKLNKPVPIGEKGRIQKLTGRRAMVRARSEQGLKGNVNAIAWLLRLARDTGREKPEVVFEIIGLFGPDD
jgi:hypothetical protein